MEWIFWIKTWVKSRKILLIQVLKPNDHLLRGEFGDEAEINSLLLHKVACNECRSLILVKGSKLFILRSLEFERSWLRTQSQRNVSCYSNKNCYRLREMYFVTCKVLSYVCATHAVAVADAARRRVRDDGAGSVPCPHAPSGDASIRLSYPHPSGVGGATITTFQTDCLPQRELGRGSAAAPSVAFVHRSRNHVSVQIDRRDLMMAVSGVSGHEDERYSVEMGENLPETHVVSVRFLSTEVINSDSSV